MKNKQSILFSMSILCLSSSLSRQFTSHNENVDRFVCQREQGRKYAAVVFFQSAFYGGKVQVEYCGFLSVTSVRGETWSDFKFQVWCLEKKSVKSFSNRPCFVLRNFRMIPHALFHFLIFIFHYSESSVFDHPWRCKRRCWIFSKHSNISPNGNDFLILGLCWAAKRKITLFLRFVCQLRRPRVIKKEILWMQRIYFVINNLEINFSLALAPVSNGEEK